MLLTTSKHIPKFRVQHLAIMQRLGKAKQSLVRITAEKGKFKSSSSRMLYYLLLRKLYKSQLLSAELG